MMRTLTRQLLETPFILLAVLWCLVMPKRRQVLMWGLDPIINNKYWSNAMRQSGWESQTVVNGLAAINKRTDFDVYADNLIPSWLGPQSVRRLVQPAWVLVYIIRHAKVVHLSYCGGPLRSTAWWRVEALLFKWSGIKTVVMPFGGDAYLYSEILDTPLRQALLLSYPELAKREPEIEQKVKYWVQHADVILNGVMMDGIGRWDVTVNSFLCVDLEQWRAKSAYSYANGRNGVVKILHTPNHRGFKGTEFIIHAVKELKEEGLQVELILLEGVSNDRVRELMQEVDLLAEQLIATGHGINAVEGMASGLPVLANLSNELYTRIFRRYGFLNECPILSTTPESVKENLRVLITNPILREQLGRAGRSYVEKYHAYHTTQYIFGSIYDKILYGKEVDLMNLFHPLKSPYNRRLPRIDHPLVENRLPESYQKVPA